MGAEALESHRVSGEKVARYTINDYPYLRMGSPMRDLFELVRKEVRALDPCVSEEFLKLYIAYKAETNFVDIVPQKSGTSLVQSICSFTNCTIQEGKRKT